MFEVLGADRMEAWRGWFDSLPREWRDVHFHPGYYAANAAPPAAQAACAVLDDADGLVLYPFLRMAITDPALVPSGEALCDLQGAPGYNGLAASSRAPALIDRFHREFRAYCRDTGVVAELTRLNPALGNQGFCDRTMTVKVLNRNVIVDLTVGEQALWQEHYSHAARKQVAKGQRNGLVTRLAGSDADLEAFHAIFADTMARNDALPEARHPLAYFIGLARGCGDQCLFYLTEHHGRPVAAELVTHGTEAAYSFLGGTLAEAFPLAANDLLKHDIIVDLRRRGLRRFCLGGGIAPGDGIHRYKLKFSAQGEVDFLLASRVHDQARFDRLVADWSAAYPERRPRGASKVLPYRF